MKNLRLPVSGLLLCLLLGGFVQKRPVSIVGKWKEFWGWKQPATITYHDVHLIRQNGPDFSISCINRSYLFHHVRFNGHVLSFEMENPSAGVHLPYRLTLSPDGSEMLGTATSGTGPGAEVHNIRWLRVP